MKRSIVFTLHYCALLGPLYAQEADNPPDHYYSLTLPEVVVNASRGMLGMTTSTGSVGDIDRMDSTQSINVIDQALIGDNAADRVENVLFWLPGVSPSSSSAGYSTAFSTRGFHSKGDLFFNGHRDNGQFFIRDLATVERVEILKGHGSVLYGSGTPGATLNYISLRPRSQPLTRFRLTLGSDRFLRNVLDTTGPVGTTRNLHYRLIVAAQDGDSSIYDNVEKRRWTVFPSLQWHYSQYGSLRLETERSYDKQPYYFGTVYTQGRILYDSSYVFPQARSDRHFGRVGLYWQHRFGKRIELRAAISHFTTRRNDILAGFYYKKNESALAGYYRLVKDAYRQESVKLELIGDLTTARLDHRLLLGVEYNSNHDKVKSKRNVGGFTLDPFKPDFNVNLSDLPLTTNNYITDNRETGLYLFDRISLSPAWALELGTRRSDFDAHIRDKDGSYDSDRTNNSVSSNTLGVVWRPRENSSYYFNVSESFKPNWGTDRNNRFFAPRETRQLEAGIRYRLADGRWSIESAIYRLTQKNLLKKDPEDREYWVLAGERQSGGLDLSLQYQPAPAFSLISTYSYTEARYAGRDNPNEGNTPASIPRHSGSIRVNYRPSEKPAWRFWSGVIAVDERFGDDANSFKIPGYALLNAGAQYHKKELKLTLSMTNALDKRYIAASFTDDDIYQGSRRTVRFSVAHGF